jgi:putative sugar O-methyltransferase
MNTNAKMFEKYKEIYPFFQKLIERKDLGEKNMAPIWAGFLSQRKNFPTFNEMITFRRSMAAFIGYLATTEDTEFHDFQFNYGRAVNCTPKQFLRENIESSVGQPFQFCQDDLLSSSAGLHNAASAFSIVGAAKQYKVPSINRILEIGAGYGGVADLLIRNFKPNTYVICDLPQNLFLSAFYLSVNHPEYKLQFVHDRSDVTGNYDKAFVFTTPDAIKFLDLEFDLAVNTYSFQEMNLQEIKKYFAYISDHLNDQGLFYFLNTHGAEGAKRPTDYPLNQFHVEHWCHYAVPQPDFLLRKQHLEVIMRKSKGQGLPPSFDQASYTLSLLMFMGLNKNITEFCTRALAGTLTTEQIEFLKTLEQVLHSHSLQEAEQILSRVSTSAYPEIVSYIEGVIHLIKRDFSNSKKHFESAISSKLAGFALSKAYVALGLIAAEQGNENQCEQYFNLAAEVSPQFKYQLANYKRLNMTLRTFTNSFKFAFPNFKFEAAPPLWRRTVGKIRRAILTPSPN